MNTLLPDSFIFYLLLILTVLASSLGTNDAFAVDVANGEALHNDNCVRCHQPDIYLRDQRMVNSYSELQEQVRQCEIMAEMTWFDEEIEDVVSYLNQTYYKFETTK